VLAAAGKLFRRKGFHGATLEEIADEAGFSKGVVYSQFGSKDDLFLSLFEQRVEWRLARVLERAHDAPPGSALPEALKENLTIQEADVEWTMAALEFRIHAARSPALQQRFANLHRRALAGIASLFELVIVRTGLRPRFTPADFARLAARLDAGDVLERLIEGSGTTPEIGRHAIWLLLTEGASPRAGEEGP